MELALEIALCPSSDELISYSQFIKRKKLIGSTFVCESPWESWAAKYLQDQVKEADRWIYGPGPKKLVPGHRNGLVQLERVINQENVLPTYVLRIDGLAVPLADVFLYRRLLM